MLETNNWEEKWCPTTKIFEMHSNSPSHLSLFFLVKTPEPCSARLGAGDEVLLFFGSESAGDMV